jgi:predicted small lipoprotein YifL
MRKYILFFFVVFSLVSCGKRGTLDTPKDEKDGYPRKYPYDYEQKKNKVTILKK